MAERVYKFSPAEGALAILKFNSIFVTSPLDLNDPFEMRPAWTDEHERRFQANEARKSEMMGASPVFICTEKGLVETGDLLPLSEPEPFIEVDAQRGISDGHNAEVFRQMHRKYRILSLVSGLVPHDEPGLEPAKATLMWAHYADQFQGVCIAMAPEDFNNGLKEGGFEVNYASSRRSLPPKEYDSFLRFPLAQPMQAGNVVDHATGLELTTTEQLVLEQHRYIDLLTHKSPAWDYEQEVRMIYELQALKESGFHKDVWIMCQKCKALGRTFDACENRYHRDAVIIPDNAIRAVIFGNDCQHTVTAEILDVLAEERYKHVEVFWCSLHPDKYEIQYNRADADYVRFIQEQRSKEVACAKGHVRNSGNGLETKAAPKGVNYPSFGSGV